MREEQVAQKFFDLTYPMVAGLTGADVWTLHPGLPRGTPGRRSRMAGDEDALETKTSLMRKCPFRRKVCLYDASARPGGRIPLLDSGGLTRCDYVATDAQTFTVRSPSLSHRRTPWCVIPLQSSKLVQTQIGRHSTQPNCNRKTSG